MRSLIPFLLVAAACGESRTELIIGVATDLQATGQLDGVELVVKRADNGTVIAMENFPISGQAGMPNNLPGSYGIFSDGEETKLDITLTGMKAGTKVVARRAVLNLVSGKTIFYRFGLASACMTKTDCVGGQDCAEGQCVSTAINAKRFPDFNETIVETVTCNGVTTYRDTTTNMPMPSSANAAQCPANLCREGTCINPLETCSVQSAVNHCRAALGACNKGCMTNDCGVGGDPMFCEKIPAQNPTPECVAAICAAFECASRATNWGSVGTMGGCGLLECQAEFADQGLACGGGTGGRAAAVTEYVPAPNARR